MVTVGMVSTDGSITSSPASCRRGGSSTRAGRVIVAAATVAEGFGTYDSAAAVITAARPMPHAVAATTRWVMFARSDAWGRPRQARSLSRAPVHVDLGRSCAERHACLALASPVRTTSARRASSAHGHLHVCDGLHLCEAQSVFAPHGLPGGQLGAHAGGPSSEASVDPSAGASAALESSDESACDESACDESACDESASASSALESASASWRLTSCCEPSTVVPVSPPPDSLVVASPGGPASLPA